MKRIVKTFDGTLKCVNRPLHEWANLNFATCINSAFIKICVKRIKIEFFDEPNSKYYVGRVFENDPTYVAFDVRALGDRVISDNGDYIGRIYLQVTENLKLTVKMIKIVDGELWFFIHDYNDETIFSELEKQYEKQTKKLHGKSKPN